jgi:general secretion pathway protein D
MAQEEAALKQEWKSKVITGILVVHLAFAAPPRVAFAAPLRAMQAAPQAPPPAPAPAAQQTDQEVPIALHLENADLLQVIGIIAAELQMNYVVDPRVQGTVHINTLGQLRRADLFPLLQMILRTSGATAVQAGNFYRIVPLQEVQRMPIAPQLTPEPGSLPGDDRLVLNVIPLRYVTAADMTRILTPFLSEGGHLLSHDAGNVLLITDSSRSMTRLLEIVSLFDTEAFTNQRARLYPVRNSQANRIVEELESVFAAYGLSRDSSAVRFVAFERINSILVVTPNPSVYPEVERWLERLDQPMQESGVRNFIYRVEYGSAEALASVLSQLLLGTGPVFIPTPGRASAVGAAATPGALAAPQQIATPPLGVIPTGAAAGAPGGELSHIRIVPDLVNNFLVIKATTQEYEQIRQILRDLDVVPRQVMIEAKVYEVDLTGALSAGVSAFLQRRTADGLDGRGTGQFGAAAGGAAALSVTMGTLIGRMRQLLLFLNASESRGEARVISAPSLLAADNLPASINVGTEIPILSSQVFGLAAQTANNPVFTNTIQNRDTGVLLTITPRVNSSGLVTLQIQQEVSVPVPPEAGAIQSPSISKRSVSTQAVVQDGETIALGGIIQESRTYSRNRIPLLGDIPYLGALFGNTSLSTQRTELILLLTPTVIRDATEARNATAEFRSKLRDLRRILEEDEKREQERNNQESGVRRQ